MADALWILVANGSRAKLFTTDERAERWDLREEFFHEESRSFSRTLLNQPDNPNAGSLHKPQPENEPDARQLIIWKEIYESLEAATDRCSDVADTIEGILLENN